MSLKAPKPKSPVLRQSRRLAKSLTEKETGDLVKAKQVYEANKDGKSIMGLDRPWFPLRNPGIVSAPIGWLVAIIFSLLFPNKREEEKFDEMYVRQTTGMGIDELIKT